MDKLYKLLTNYNSRHYNQIAHHRWMIQYTQYPIPTYWKVVYNLIELIDKKKFVIEIGSGGGDILSILCHLNFENVLSYERDYTLFNYTKHKIYTLFGRKETILNLEYPQLSMFIPDVLILVNCVYFEGITTKEGYLDQLYSFYVFNGIPKLFIMEVIDDSYCEENQEFPHFIRLNSKDISKTFTHCDITQYTTYKYPQNKVSKTLYCISSNSKL